MNLLFNAVCLIVIAGVCAREKTWCEMFPTAGICASKHIRAADDEQINPMKRAAKPFGDDALVVDPTTYEYIYCAPGTNHRGKRCINPVPQQPNRCRTGTDGRGKRCFNPVPLPYIPHEDDFTWPHNLCRGTNGRMKRCIRPSPIIDPGFSSGLQERKKRYVGGGLTAENTGARVNIRDYVKIHKRPTYLSDPNRPHYHGSSSSNSNSNYHKTTYLSNRNNNHGNYHGNSNSNSNYHKTTYLSNRNNNHGNYHSNSNSNSNYHKTTYLSNSNKNRGYHSNSNSNSNNYNTHRNFGNHGKEDSSEYTNREMHAIRGHGANYVGNVHGSNSGNQNNHNSYHVSGHDTSEYADGKRVYGHRRKYNNLGYRV